MTDRTEARTTFFTHPSRVMIKQQTCPICDGSLPTETPSTFPFCSARCQQVDLYRWGNGNYKIVNQLDPHEAQLMAMEGDLPLVDDDSD
ncbi:MAG: DNA gyrase inhibitor YacG [Planctomycetaceae bacterium]